MGLYNVLFGMNQQADQLLAVLGLTRSSVGRFRDAFVADGEIAVYTRNGGGNRDDYQDVFDELRQHPCYLRDEDDAFDCTYATIYFRIPENAALVLGLQDIGPWEPDQRWADMIQRVRDGTVPIPPEIEAMFGRIKRAVEAAAKGGAS